MKIQEEKINLQVLIRQKMPAMESFCEIRKKSRFNLSSEMEICIKMHGAFYLKGSQRK